MATAKRESRSHAVNPARKYIRLQEIGLSHFLAWPVGMMVATMYGLDYQIPQISVLVLVSGVIFFAIGHVGRQELKEKQGKVNHGNNDTDKP